MAGDAIYGAAGLLFWPLSAGGSVRQTFQPLPFLMHSCMIAVFSRDTPASCLSQSSIDSTHIFWDQSTARNDAVMEQIEQLEEAPVTKPEETRRVYEPPAIIYESLISARAGTNPIGRFEGPVPPFEDPATD